MSGPRGRIVRKLSLWSKIKSYPYDVVLSWNERIQLVDWDSIAIEHSILISFIMNLLLVICQMYINQNSTIKYKTLKVASKKNHFLVYVKLFYFILNGTCWINFFWCVTSFKNYDLITRDINNVPHTPSLFKIQLDRPAAVEDDDSFLIIRLCKWAVLKLYHRIFPKDVPAETNKRMSWRLIVWSPSSFSLHFIALFSPLNSLFIAMITPFGFSNLVFLFILSIFQYFIIIFKYETKLKDQFIIQQNFLHEYDSKFVNPRLNKICVDKSVDGWNNGTVRLFYPDKRSKQFITHNL